MYLTYICRREADPARNQWRLQIGRTYSNHGTIWGWQEYIIGHTRRIHVSTHVLDKLGSSLDKSRYAPVSN